MERTSSPMLCKPALPCSRLFAAVQTTPNLPQCDGKDYTEIIRRKGLEAVAFLNIYSYAAGTRPWGTKAAVDNFKAPRIDDGLVEVCPIHALPPPLEQSLITFFVPCFFFFPMENGLFIFLPRFISLSLWPTPLL